MAEPVVTSRELAGTVGAQIQVGKAFAFLTSEALASSALGWLRGLFGSEPRPQVVPLLGPKPVALPGVTLAPRALPALHLAVVTADKPLYREGRDTVNLLVLDPAAPGREVVLVAALHGAEYTRRPVRLDGSGAAAVRLSSLPTGDYEVRLAGAPGEDPACTFTVAQYRLSALVASLAERSLEGRQLAVTLRLESFGVPLEGGVRLELLDRGRRLATVNAVAGGGLARGHFVLDGEGPHSINVQVVSDPSRTATVPLTGSRAAERAQTVLNPLGTEVTASLLPSAEATELRGLYLSEGALVTTPFRVEGYGTARPRLVAAAEAGPVRVLLVDPTTARPRPGAVDPATAPHPFHEDERYRLGSEQFKAQSFREAADTFASARARLAAPHPNYAYYVACCEARLGRKEAALSALRQALEDGWRDHVHLSGDPDLQPLHDDSRFQALLAGGVSELSFERLAAGDEVPLPVSGALTLACVGAVVDGKAWEGWSLLLGPQDLAPRVLVAETARPGDEVTLAVETGGTGEASVYLVVKDARLLAGDRPGSRLAGQVKAHAAALGRELAVGSPTETLAQLVDRLAPVREMTRSGGRVFSAMPPPPLPAYAPRAAAAPPARFVEQSEEEGMFTGGMLMEPMAGLELGSDVDFDLQTEEAEEAAPAPAATAAARPARRATSADDPDVLFADLLPVRAGRAEVRLRLGPGFADYVAEAFVAAGVSWAPAEARFRAAQETFVQADLPPYVHSKDAAEARLHVGSASGRAKVRLLRDGAPATLLLDGRPLPDDGSLAARRAELTFLAEPGTYEAAVEDAGGEVERWTGRVEVPGVFHRFARTLRLLDKGESVARKGEVTDLRVLPGVDTSFKLLMDATTDYGHACCEQTAAKILAAVSMYAFAGEEGKQRARAEEVILAGIRREETMFLPGRGFRMYPESGNEPNTYFGPKAASYLTHLGVLRGLQPSRALSQAVDRGLEMAQDALRAYRVPWPPDKPQDPEAAYAAQAFHPEASVKALALKVARDYAAQAQKAFAGGATPSPAVLRRAQTAYAAAVLLKGGVAADRGLAVTLANVVLKDLEQTGRLYSTVDSVGAIALLAEVRAAGLGASGQVKVRLAGGEERTLGVGEAAALAADLEEVAVVDGGASVEVTMRRAEDWQALRNTATAAVALLREGRPTRRLQVGEAVDLSVKLPDGYRDGDLVWVCLPHALTRVVGGGQVKLFSVDFEGRPEVTVPLAVTSPTLDRVGGSAPQRFAVCVRNMFEEERAASAGFLEVTATRA